MSEAEITIVLRQGMAAEGIETGITKFAEQYRLRTQRDSQGEVFIPCQRGQIYHHGGDTLGVMVITEGRARSSPSMWANVRRGLLAVGFTLHPKRRRRGFAVVRFPQPGDGGGGNAVHAG